MPGRRVDDVKRNRLPSLPDTGRRYVDQTGRVRLASPGVERYETPRSGGRNVVIALAIGAALLAAMLWLS
jgi:hypothetical protein